MENKKICDNNLHPIDDEQKIYYSKKQVEEFFDNEKENIIKRMEGWIGEDFAMETQNISLTDFLKIRISNYMENRKRKFFQNHKTDDNIHRRIFELCESIVEWQRKKQKTDDELVLGMKNIETFCLQKSIKNNNANETVINNNQNKYKSNYANNICNNNNNNKTSNSFSSSSIQQWNFVRKCRSCECEMAFCVWEEDDLDDWGQQRKEWLKRLYWICLNGCTKLSTGGPIRFFFDDPKHQRSKSYYRNFVIPRTQKAENIEKINAWLNACTYLSEE